MDNPCAWVNRSGKYFPVNCAEHDAWAREYMIENYGKEKAHEKRMIGGKKIPFYEVLEKWGWVKIMSWPKIKTTFIIEKPLTHSQKQTVYKYCKKYHLPLPFEDPLFNE